MGRCVIMKKGSGGIDPDELTATRSQVLTGYTAGVKGEDEPAAGTMPNRGIGSHAVNSGINDKGLWYYIQPGYYPGSVLDEGNCWIYRSANEVASTIGLNSSILKAGSNVLGIKGDGWTVWTGDATALPQDVINGKTYWHQGVKRTGTLTIQSVVSFSAAQYSNLTIRMSWALPSKGPWSGIQIKAKQGGYPNDITDGIQVYYGSGTSGIRTLDPGTWYLRGWNFITTNNGNLINPTPVQAVINNQKVKGQQIFTSSGAFTPPVGVSTIDIFCVGGGASGHSSSGNSKDGGGGGSGYTTTVKGVAFEPGPGLKIAVTIGAGGASEPRGGTPGNPGGDTYVTINGVVKARASGGTTKYRGSTTRITCGTDGGSGGGSAYYTNSNGVGGTNGSDGYPGQATGGAGGGLGQKTTTRAFGESNNTLYAGGGGGGRNYKGVNSGGAGGGGNGGGGNGADWINATAGVAGTGGGGGGAAGGGSFGWPSGAGGSGICIIRWGY